MSYMFTWCQYLTDLNLSNFNTSKVTNMRNMFQNCKRLTNLNLKNATFDNVTNYTNMFVSVPTAIKVITKNETTKAWLTDKLGSGATITIA